MTSGAFHNPWRQVRWAAFAIGLQASASALADDQDLFVRPEDLRTVLFGSLDAGDSNFGTLGIKQSLRGSLDRSGPVTMSSVGYGRTREGRLPVTLGSPDDEGPPEVVNLDVVRHVNEASALLGYQWALDGIMMTALVGPEVRNEQLTFDGALIKLPSPRLGARVHWEVWANPTANTVATATVIAGSAGTPHLWSRASFGYRVWRNIFIGPEASLYRTETYREHRLGAHVTGLAIGRMNLGLSAGWRGVEETRHHGAYVSVSAYVRM